MPAPMLRIAISFIAPVLYALSVIALLRGHNEPGGGFIGGLLAVIAVVLQLLYGDEKLYFRRPQTPPYFMAIGLGMAVISGLLAVVMNQPFMTGGWLGAIWLPIVGKLKIGTPFIFDIGVYLVVIGISVGIVRAIVEVED